jgi:hypothetical protein
MTMTMTKKERMTQGHDRENLELKMCKLFFEYATTVTYA